MGFQKLFHKGIKKKNKNECEHTERLSHPLHQVEDRSTKDQSSRASQATSRPKIASSIAVSFLNVTHQLESLEIHQPVDAVKSGSSLQPSIASAPTNSSALEKNGTSDDKETPEKGTLASNSLIYKNNLWEEGL